jgi:hypothetical protein
MNLARSFTLSDTQALVLTHSYIPTRSLTFPPSIQYPTCASNNLADTINGQYITSAADKDQNYNFASSTTPTAYDCCMAAYQSPLGNPGTYIYIPAGFGSGTNCFIYSSTTCASQQASRKSGPYSASGTASDARPRWLDSFSAGSTMLRTPEIEDTARRVIGQEVGRWLNFRCSYWQDIATVNTSSESDLDVCRPPWKLQSRPVRSLCSRELKLSVLAGFQCLTWRSVYVSYVQYTGTCI